jgi:hypothetical protein
MSKPAVLIAALAVSLFAGVEQVHANPELLTDGEAECSAGSKIECSRKSTSECTRWTLVEVQIGKSTHLQRECSTWVTTTTIKYVRPA